MKNLLGQDQKEEITSSDSDFSEEEYDYSLQDEEVLVPKVKPWDVFEVSDSFLKFIKFDILLLKVQGIQDGLGKF